DWTIVREFKDSDLSASRHAKKARGDFEDLIDTITHNPAPEGVVRIVVAYEASRYYRDLDAYLRLRKACMASNVLLCYNGQVYDLSRRDDRKATAQHAIDAEDEADAIQDRNARTTTLQAQAGKPHGRLPFGYAREYAVVGGRQRCIRQYEDPVRGPVVLKALQHIDSGKSVRSLLQWMNSTPEAARPDGAPWSPRTVRILLLNRAYLGERLHNGAYLKGSWDPIKGLDTPQGRAMFNRVTAKLTDPDRRSARGTEVSHLLSYLALCGECGDHAMLCAQSRKGGRPNLTCELNRDVTMAEEVVDAYVEEHVIDWFSRKDVARAALVPNDEDVAEKMATIQRLINGYEEQLRETRALAKTFDEATGRPKLSAASLADMEQTLSPKLEAERKKLRDLTGVSPLLLGMLEADDPDVRWNGRPATETDPAVPALTLEQKREIIRKVVTVRLHKASRWGSNKVDLSRIRLAFFGEPGFRAGPLRVPGTSRAEGPGLAAASGTE
ncbi:recombinase family protein, partial [Streptomyces aurantiogriseus]|uniref:recombinase family protein n=1 Tax=Streptomyces aurantiogriseus TaxID=66870 RepID=UPI0016753F35